MDEIILTKIYPELRNIALLLNNMQTRLTTMEEKLSELCRDIETIQKKIIPNIPIKRSCLGQEK